MCSRSKLAVIVARNGCTMVVAWVLAGMEGGPLHNAIYLSMSGSCGISAKARSVACEGYCNYKKWVVVENAIFQRVLHMACQGCLADVCTFYVIRIMIKKSSILCNGCYSYSLDF
jgi:hypothetical protein